MLLVDVSVKCFDDEDRALDTFRLLAAGKRGRDVLIVVKKRRVCAG